jgi:adenylate cyclase, class 2
MAIEIEKKYRLTSRQRTQVLKRLANARATFVSDEFEENTLYTGPGIDRRNSVLRLRRVGSRAILTFKKRFPQKSSIKHQQEEEVTVHDAQACDVLLQALGYRQALVYEKWRETWRLGAAEVVLDELPFGNYMEIEAAEAEIERVEALLDLSAVAPEHSTYPKLTAKHGKKTGKLVEARFGKRKASSTPRGRRGR